MIKNEYKKASRVFYAICKFYNQWKNARKATEQASRHEFGIDEYIRVKASYAECLMNVG
jgi:hypothetical protein